MKGLTARIMYHKCGLARFIGHLDTVRVLQRAVRRAGIEGVYSQGFSPKLKLSYSDPLPLGVTSQCEFFDIKLAGPPSQGKSQADAMTQNLQSHLPEGFLLERVDFLEGNPSSLQKAFWAAAYEIELPRDCPVNRENVEPFTMKRESSSPSSDEADEAGAGHTSRVVRASWRENDRGDPVFSVVLRQDIPGKGGLKQAICDILGISREILDGCRIHKKRVYGNGEVV
jgi:radical SAM-linked protein